MERLHEKRDYDAASIIQQFLTTSSLAEGVAPREESLIARLCLEAIEVFQSIIIDLGSLPTTGGGEETVKGRSDRGARISLERSYSRLNLWFDGYGIGVGKVDDTFAKSQKLRRATLKILISVSETLYTRLFTPAHISPSGISKSRDDHTQKLKMLTEAAHNDVDDDDDSSSDSLPEYDSDSLSDIAEDLRVDTMCLMDLDPLFRSPVLDLEWEKSILATGTEDWAPHHAYSDRIRARFPNAIEPLISRLGRAAYERYLQCQAKRDRQSVAGDEEGLESLLQDWSGGSSSKFRDSALGSSIPSSASNADTVMSYHHGDDWRSTRVPLLPEGAKAGNPFPCIACGKSIVIRSNSAWKRHLYHDLLPWQCLDLDCSFTMVFTSREDWSLHLAHDHGLAPDWKATKCPLCLDDIGPEKLQITSHLSSHLEEISLGALPSDQPEAESDNDSSQEQSDAELDSNDKYSSTEPRYVEDSAYLHDKDEPGSTSNQTYSSPNAKTLETDAPILEDALQYLDRIKVEFNDTPETYNAFLDIMNDFKEKRINTIEVMTEVRNLMSSHPHLLQGFNSFLPSGYAFDEVLNITHPEQVKPH